MANQERKFNPNQGSVCKLLRPLIETVKVNLGIKKQEGWVVKSKNKTPYNSELDQALNERFNDSEML